MKHWTLARLLAQRGTPEANNDPSEILDAIAVHGRTVASALQRLRVLTM